MREIEREAIMQTLERTSGNIKKALTSCVSHDPRFTASSRNLALRFERRNEAWWKESSSTLCTNKGGLSDFCSQTKLSHKAQDAKQIRFLFSLSVFAPSCGNCL
jgi:hypothetical protein